LREIFESVAVIFEDRVVSVRQEDVAGYTSKDFRLREYRYRIHCTIEKLECNLIVEAREHTSSVESETVAG
jgi:hypothetical protein